MWHISIKVSTKATLCVSMKKICQLMKRLYLKNKTLTQIVKKNVEYQGHLKVNVTMLHVGEKVLT